MPAERDRFRALLEATMALSSELSLDALLQKLVETAAELTGARYAALGVIDSTGRQLERFLTAGIDEEAAAEIGDRPRGRGILGALIRDARPLRLGEIADDPRSVGFPPNHPPMHVFLGVPILLRGTAFGNLYLTEKEGGEFTAEDEEIATLLAGHAAVAIENARLYESATRWLRQLESLQEVGNALSTEIELPRLLDLIARRLRELVAARLVLIALPAGDELRVEAAAGDPAEQLLGTTFSFGGSKLGRSFERRRSERVDSLLDDPEVDQALVRRLGARTALNVPLVVRDRAIGVIAAFDRESDDPRFGDDDLRLAETLATRAATAVSLSEQVTRDALRKVVDAQELERKRLARELHDETGQALTSLLLGLRALESAEDLAAVRKASEALRGLVVGTLQDVRRLAVELRPSALDDFGLVPALERLVDTFSESSAIRVDLVARLGETRLSTEAETVLYRTVQESLTNVVKHAGAQSVSISLTRKNGAVAAVIEDDGRGFEPETIGDGLGLVGIRERVALVGGRVAIESAPGAGTTIAIEVPA
jgi:signal transduction histidine kinase